MNDKILKKEFRNIGVFIYVISILMVSLATYFDAKLVEVFSLMYWEDSRLIHWWSYFTYIFEHSIYFDRPSANHWFLFVHMGTNLSVIFLYGILTERRMGTNHFLIVSFLAYISNLTFILVERRLALLGVAGSVAGASGVVFSYIPLGIYFHIKNCKENGKSIIKSIRTWLILISIIFLYGVISFIAGAWTTICHLLSTVVGAIYILAVRKNVQVKYSRCYLLVLLIPLFLAGILVAYKMGKVPIYYKLWI
ncbi:MAG: rhomboid family intramembrane serine protease [Lachnospiraceae bacterium]|nr:rhomboid family intramembrane serine protease [Lachnospiraceae bacterium]